jgi:outer membrane biosynthesis protein TonB
MRLRNHNSDCRASILGGSTRGVLRRGRGQSVFFGVPLFAMLFLGLGGCPGKPAHRVAVGKEGLIRPPHTMPRDVDTTPPVVNPPAPPRPRPPQFPAPMSPTVRRPANAPEPEPEPVKAEAPQISPQLSDVELARAKASTTANIIIAQQNLDSASGKRLNATQQDMTDKIRGFLKQAQDAIAVSDWNRASSLAEKARLLSDELVKSLRS